MPCTKHCSICRKPFRGSFKEVMDKIRSHRKKVHPKAHSESVRKSRGRYDPLKVRKKLIANPAVKAYVDAKTDWAVVRVLHRKDAPALAEFGLQVTSGRAEVKEALKAADFTDEGSGKWALRTNQFNIFVYLRR